MATLSKKLGLGRLAYQLYHRPVAALGASVRAGGPIEQWRTERGRLQMEQAARGLSPLPGAPAAGPPLELHLMTGRRFWYQTAFCLWTLGRQSGRTLAPMIYDDGSLKAEWRDLLSRIVPAARFVSVEETVAVLDAHIPTGKFPVLRERWLHFPLIRKLTDVHVGKTGWKLFIDSDLLFFHYPELLVGWIDRPTRPLRAMDVQNAYGYPLEMLSSLAGRPVPELVNTGLCGLRSEDIDWERMEFWCRTLIERGGTQYYQEQALVALLLAGVDCAVAPIEDYVTFPRPPEVNTCRAVMHHYVADSKRAYFRDNWRRALAAHAAKM